MSLFKRKGRRISTFEDEEPGDASVGDEEPSIQVPVKFGKRPSKQSALRRNTSVGDPAEGNDGDIGEDDEGPAVVRPSIGRISSTRSKKRMSSSTRLSFGVGAVSEASEATTEDRTSATTPRRTGITSLSQRVLETNAFRKSLSGRLPTRPLDTEDEDRPRYSKEHLEELQSSTPNTPRNVASKRHEDGDASDGRADADVMQLDVSELEGATVVESSDLAALRTGALATSAPAAHVLTQTEIQERKDRRQRLALEKNALAMGSEDDEENGYISLVSGDGNKKKRKEESRLVREDEDLGEGYDEFVEDGGLSLGRKAEREARRRRKQEMATLISAAEGGGGGHGDGADNDEDGVDSDDSEAERQAAYNAAQTRAGMDGLKRRGGGSNEDDEDEMNVLRGTAAASSTIPKMQPLPELADCLARMQRIVLNLENEAAQRRQKLAEIEAEKAEILAREAEVQELLNAAGQKYQAILGGDGSGSSSSMATTDPASVAAAAAAMLATTTQSPLRPLPVGGPAERGLESLGGTPVRRADKDDVF
ncbi:hypothetical protein CMQ_640 [Grosmannia clavigera kw1407]|uniref:Nineteen complex-related protein 2-domain-containing protein n=1 Tax=Grosmannia clavigera (strain kw1407 / UAMH 11150) TaxID=655863 RepID=F0XCV0_GROCL|nr:uncharacterized protein CMQ_640 [Grosmannia clavigera kw1407]EFX03712.1 hypothetical protein CMQ_640 [Grosmannia clavigera kw1407]